MPRRILPLLAATAGLLAASLPDADALEYVTTANGATYGIHDAAAPGLDTGSIRDVSTTGTNRANAVFGFGGLRLHVPDTPATDPTGRFDSELMRGFGLTFNARESFTTTTPVTQGGVTVERDIRVLTANNAVRFLDAFTNTRATPVTIDVAFGGTAGTGVAGNRSVVTATSDGDTAIEAGDAWVAAAVPSATDATRSARGPLGVVLGSPAPFAGALSGIGNFQRDPFGSPLPASGLDANFYGFTNRLTLQPGQTRTLLRYVVTGLRESAADGVAAGAQTTAVTNATQSLATTPDLSGLTRREKCGLANWDAAVVPAIDSAQCPALGAVAAAPAPAAAEPVTSSAYDVVDKSIAQLQTDMEAGRATSVQITQAYLDRIAAYDVGQYGFHSFIHVNEAALEQARAADARRAAGETGDLLGIPVAVKDLYDTKDMPTTDGTRALANWRPRTDAFQVARMRDAGAVLIGKTNLSEFANSGSYSESGFMMTWNALDPSKSPLGSSGGSASATALSLAGISMGTQTGVSLFAPSTGASLVTLRGTDGISSGAGVMPLTYLQDFEGPIARTTTDVAMLLNVTTGTDPDDPATVAADADGKRPDDWMEALDPDALDGARIGYVPASFTGAAPYEYTYGQDDGTGQALLDRFDDLEAAGATMVPMTGPLPTTANGPSTGDRSRTEEGWQAYWGRHPEAPFRTASDILSAPENLPYNQRTQAPAPRLTDVDVAGIIGARNQSKANYAAWMDANDVDAVVYPGFRSDVYDNDGAQVTSSDRSSGYPTSSFGLPTLVLPVGANPNGYAMSLQFVGRAFDDEQVLGFGYALEQRLGAAGRVRTGMAPALRYDAGAQVPTPEPTPAPQPQTPAPAPAPADNAQPTPVPAATTPEVEAVVRVGTRARLAGRRIRVTVRNTGTTTVAGRLVVRGRVVVRVKGKRVARTVRFGTARGVSVAAGRSKTVSVLLNRRARQLLARRTSVRLTVGYALKVQGAAGTSGTEVVTARR